MTLVFFRHDIYIDNISVYQTWHLPLWHQCFQTWHIHLWHQCFSDMTSTLMTSVLFFYVPVTKWLGHIVLPMSIIPEYQYQIKFTFRSGPMIFGILQTWHTHLWHQHVSDMTSKFVHFTWHLYLWQQRFSDMTATFITSLFFRHDIYIYDISGFL